jgi:hypothetical protein
MNLEFNKDLFVVIRALLFARKHVVFGLLLVCSCTSIVSGSDEAKHQSKKFQNFSFDVLGDTGYTISLEQELKELIQDTINHDPVRFVMHIGDIQNDPRGLKQFPKSVIGINKDKLAPKRDLLFSINKPFFFTPGDNDWADTYVAPISNPDPLATLSDIRDLFYSKTNVNFTFKVVKQPEEFPNYSEFIENQRWIVNGIVFVTVHNIAGKENNGLDAAYPKSVQDESRIRIAANQTWLKRAFEVVEETKARGLVIFSQAVVDWVNPSSGFVDMVNLIQSKAKQYGDAVQILYCFGDNHQFLVQKPIRGEPMFTADKTPIYRQRENFTTLEVPGAPRVAVGTADQVAGATGRVRLTVNFDDPDLFNMYLSTRNEGKR